MLGLLGLRIFEATAADIADLGEEHGHRVLRVCSSPRPPASGLPGHTPYAPPYLRHDHADAGVDLRDVQIAACHADPRTTMRYDRACQNLDRHPNYILAAYMASGT